MSLNLAIGNNHYGAKFLTELLQAEEHTLLIETQNGESMNLLGWSQKTGTSTDLVGRVIQWNDGGCAVLTNQFLLELDHDYSPELGAMLEDQLGLAKVWPIDGLPQLAVARLDANRDFLPHERLHSLREHSSVRSAEFDLIAFTNRDTALEASLVAPTSAVPWQWGDQGIGATNFDPNVAGPKVAVIDLGFDDQDSRITYSSRIRFSSNAQEVKPGARTTSLWSPHQEQEHGTYCAGLIAAQETHRISAAPKANLILVGIDVLCPSTMIAAFMACATESARVISCSLFPRKECWKELPTKLDKILQETLAGIPIFCATSNQDEDLSLNLLASHPAAIAVGRHDKEQLRAPGGTGRKLEFLAPGVNVSGAVLGGGVQTLSGTSASAACAAGVAALLLQQRPHSTLSEVIDACRNGCRPLEGQTGRTDKLGHGALDARLALAKLPTP